MTDLVLIPIVPVHFWGQNLESTVANCPRCGRTLTDIHRLCASYDNGHTTETVLRVMECPDCPLEHKHYALIGLWNLVPQPLPEWEE